MITEYFLFFLSHETQSSLEHLSNRVIFRAKAVTTAL